MEEHQNLGEEITSHLVAKEEVRGEQNLAVNGKEKAGDYVSSVTGFSSPVESDIIDDLGLSTAEYSLFGSFLTIGGALGALACGKMSDCLGRRGILVYVAEIIPKNFRGRFVTLHMGLMCSGIASAYVLGVFIPWRVLAAIAAQGIKCDISTETADIKVLSVVISLLSMDRVGRRPLLKMYCAFDAIGIGGISYILISEIYPINIKGLAGSVATLVGWVTSWLVSYASMEWSSAGVYDIAIDMQQGKVSVTGSVEPEELIKKLEKSGKRAELWKSDVTGNDSKKSEKKVAIDQQKPAEVTLLSGDGKNLQQMKFQELLEKMKSESKDSDGSGEGEGVDVGNNIKRGGGDGGGGMGDYQVGPYFPTTPMSMINGVGSTGPMQGNPYQQQQQYMAMMMMNQQRMINGGGGGGGGSGAGMYHHPAAMYWAPPPLPPPTYYTDRVTHMFSDENPGSCTII
ncbi:hypothetical protein V2J09_001165 [Rumex salicifolius]